MKYALINPPWPFTGSVYFGCQQQHLPLEFGYSRQVLEAAGHAVRLIDAQLEELSNAEIGQQLAEFAPDITVVTTAPSYLFWRCAPPELRIPLETVRSIRPWAGALIIVGPHASTTPKATLKKLGADAVVLGECEEILPLFAEVERRRWDRIPSVCYEEDGGICMQDGCPHAADMKALPPLRWERRLVAKHRHHHHRFDAEPAAPGAEMEVSRGRAYHCTFCAKRNFRGDYRKRHPVTVLEELDGLLELGVEYVYFIDEIFLPDPRLLGAFSERPFKFGIQTRVELWKPSMLELLGQAGCVSLEAGVEGLPGPGRDRLATNCTMSLDELTERLIYAKRGVPFVQANLLESQDDDPSAVEAWRREMQKHGIWATQPMPLFPCPGSPEYTLEWNLPDDVAWERAVDYYLDAYSEFGDIQGSKPQRTRQLEAIDD